MLSITALEKRYPGFVFGPVDIEVDDDILAVLGPSGCGKTTLLSLVAGIDRPDAGTVTLNGTVLDSHPPEARGTVLVFQDGALFPHMTARENVAYAATNTDAIDDLAETLEIADVLDNPANTLSGGEKKRVALARALAADPDALLLDEPVANLDAPIKRRLRFDLRDILAGLDVPVIYVTHDQHDATVIGDRIAVMQDGHLEQVGTPTEVFERPASRFVASFTGSTNLCRATVTDSGDDHLVLEWGDLDVETPGYGFEPGDDVWFSIRPEYVMILNAHSRDRRNTIDGEITHRVFEGDGYTLTFEPKDAPDTLQIRLTAPVYDRLELADRDRIQVALKRRVIHVLPA